MSMLKLDMEEGTTCYPRKNRGKPGEQKMADLPRERLVMDLPPFSNIGLDYFGPLEVRRGRSTVKRKGTKRSTQNIRPKKDPPSSDEGGSSLELQPPPLLLTMVGSGNASSEWTNPLLPLNVFKVLTFTTGGASSI
ncbi:hypothetical protein AALO_G00179310 [Alosa alosa]|uniref:Uncharacterized protein n=1 Tax=Alosa alosa TaxID=278164 RepID=A0AAV6GD15_9TELE|nr:hypothetical protein AALO_G00179310 [Alosa alosa]